MPTVVSLFSGGGGLDLGLSTQDMISSGLLIITKMLSKHTKRI